MKFLLLLLLTVQAIAATDPTIRGSSSGATKNKFVNLEVPANQVTKVGNTTYSVETGNSNLLVNPSFEHVTDGQGWSTSTTGPSATYISQLSSGSYGSPEYGLKHVQLECNGFFGGAGTCSFYQDVTTKSGAQGNFYMRITADQNAVVTLHNRIDGTAITDTKLIRTVDTTGAIGRISKLYKLPRNLGTTSSGIEVRITVTAVQVPLVIVDDAFVGPVDLKVDVDQSRIVGDATIVGTTSCSWTNSTSSYTDFSANANCPAATVVKGFTGIAQLPQVSYSNLPSGEYELTADIGQFEADASGEVGCVRLTDGTNTGTAKCHVDNNIDGISAELRLVFTTTGVTTPTFKVQGVDTTLNNNAVPAGKSIKFVLRKFGSGSVYSDLNADTRWASCGHTTSDFTGFGTVSLIETQCRRDGSDLLMRGKFTSGTSTAVEGRLALRHAGVALTSKTSADIPSIQTAGHAGVNASTVSSMVLIEPAVGYVTFGQQVATGSGALSKMLGSSYLGSGSQATINARIPIDGWDQSNIIIAQLNGLESCADSYECTDSFDTYVDAAGVPANESLDFINGNCAITSTSTYTCTYKTGLVGSGVSLANPMVCTATVNSSVNYDATIVGLTNTTFVVRVKDSNTGAAQALGFAVHCGKVGADRVAKTAKAVASDQNLRSIGSIGVDVQSVYFGSGTNCTTVCSTGTCSICRQVGSKITSATFSATGKYRLNGVDGTKYSCKGQGYTNRYVPSIQVISDQTSSYAQIEFLNDAGTLTNAAYIQATCIGIP